MSAIRWVPSKSSRMGIAADPEVQAALAQTMPAASAQAAAPQASSDHTVMEKLIFGGLLLAGATMVVTLAFGGPRN